MANKNSLTVELDQFQGNENNTMRLPYVTNRNEVLVTSELVIGEPVEIQCWECGQWVIHYNYCSRCGSKIVNMQERASKKLFMQVAA